MYICVFGFFTLRVIEMNETFSKMVLSRSAYRSKRIINNLIRSFRNWGRSTTTDGDETTPRTTLSLKRSQITSFLRPAPEPSPINAHIITHLYFRDVARPPVFLSLPDVVLNRSVRVRTLRDDRIS